MATHTADIRWTLKDGDDVAKGRFSRGHEMRFDGGVTVPASASPHVVGKWAVEAAVDPEEMLVAALSSCHMLSFLHVARLAGFAVAAYSRPCGGGDGGHRARTDGGDKGGVAPANRVDGLCSGQGEAGASAPPGARHLLHRQFGDNASDGGIGLLAAAHEAAGVCASSNAARSAARATLRAFIRASRPRGSTSCAGRSSGPKPARS